jgi:hypothetical protein
MAHLNFNTFFPEETPSNNEWLAHAFRPLTPGGGLKKRKITKMALGMHKTSTDRGECAVRRLFA